MEALRVERAAGTSSFRDCFRNGDQVCLMPRAQPDLLKYVLMLIHFSSVSSIVSFLDVDHR